MAVESKLGEARGAGLGRNKASLGVGECCHCGGLLSVKVKVGKGLYLRPYHEGEGIIRSIGSTFGNNSMPDVPDTIKNIPLLGTLASMIY